MPLSLLYSSSLSFWGGPFITNYRTSTSSPFVRRSLLSLATPYLGRRWSVEYCWNRTRLEPSPFLHSKLRSKSWVDLKTVLSKVVTTKKRVLGSFPLSSSLLYLLFLLTSQNAIARKLKQAHTIARDVRTTSNHASVHHFFARTVVLRFFWRHVVTTPSLPQNRIELQRTQLAVKTNLVFCRNLLSKKSPKNYVNSTQPKVQE